MPAPSSAASAWTSPVCLRLPSCYHVMPLLLVFPTLTLPRSWMNCSNLPPTGSTAPATGWTRRVTRTHTACTSTSRVRCGPTATGWSARSIATSPSTSSPSSRSRVICCRIPRMTSASPPGFSVATSPPTRAARLMKKTSPTTPPTACRRSAGFTWASPPTAPSATTTSSTPSRSVTTTRWPRFSATRRKSPRTAT